jgi:hypothetical protein
VMLNCSLALLLVNGLRGVRAAAVPAKPALVAGQGAELAIENEQFSLLIILSHGDEQVKCQMHDFAKKILAPIRGLASRSPGIVPRNRAGILGTPTSREKSYKKI